ncbi:DUF6268 family outer membrane beta-barrel protein [Winogradskyella sp. PG-2]|uniref:DUF6268 family outer membrane beta-barrel protein n=1 Tax=Winogradskyella sp. PG-2 TaxID=754409 RepID=UPI00045877D8|nr:DUF6268 family outer membrane beta-barrel protein [Winogradskyella sp. PG-2]BAO74559.1 hypothetical protein WPG_0329 [Winogradskyella sp. PG-2]
MIKRFSNCNILLVWILVCSFHFAEAQLTDLARLEYSFIPNRNSEDNYTRLRASVNYPIKIKDKDYLIVGAEYNRIILNLEDDYQFDQNNLNRLNIIDLNLGYTFKANENWRLGLKVNPRIASTLTSTITSDDIFLNGGIFAVKDRTDAKDIEKPYRFIFGLTYNTTAGVPFPLPFVSYYRRVNDKWSFSVGVPKSNLKYFFNEHNMLQVFAGLDGYFANIQKPMLINERTVNNISLSIVLGGLGYEYCFTKHLVAYSYIGYTFRLNNVLRNENRDEVFKLNELNAFYFRSGIKFKI